MDSINSTMSDTQQILKYSAKKTDEVFFKTFQTFFHLEVILSSNFCFGTKDRFHDFKSLSFF